MGKNLQQNLPRDENLISDQNKIRIKKQWSKEEDIYLKQAISYEGTNWRAVAQHLTNRNPSQCAQRWKRIKPQSYKLRKMWKEKEDKQLLALLNIYGKNWKLIKKFMKTRSSKQIRERFVNKLDPNINHNKFTEKEDKQILEAYQTHGSKWTLISSLVPGRSENAIKNRFYSYIRSKYLNIKNPYYTVPESIQSQEVQIKEEKQEEASNNQNIKEINDSLSSQVNQQDVNKNNYQQEFLQFNPMLNETYIQYYSNYNQNLVIPGFHPILIMQMPYMFTNYTYTENLSRHNININQ